jgi:hypothetical protein
MSIHSIFRVGSLLLVTAFALPAAADEPAKPVDPPAPRVSMGKPRMAKGGTLPKGTEGALSAIGPALETCYREAIDAGHEDSPTIELRLELVGPGRVASAAINTSTDASAKLRGCVRDSFAGVAAGGVGPQPVEVLLSIAFDREVPDDLALSPSACSSECDGDLSDELRAEFRVRAIRSAFCFNRPAARKAPPPKKKRQTTPPAERSLGWEAIDAALAKVHGDVEPFHYRPVLPAVVGGEDPLEGISVYRSERGEPHWHFVTYGFSDLHEKTSDDPEQSGFGFELTFRLRRGDEQEPPAWAYNVLQNLARYVFRTGNPFGVGHHVPLNGPIALGAETEIHSVAFALDPELGEISTPYGGIEFLQMVGITRDEARAIKRWSSTGMLELLAKRDPLLITSLDRPSLLSEPATRAEIDARTAREGSSSAASFTTQLAYVHGADGVHLTLGAIAVEDLVALIQGRILFDREFSLMGRGTIVSFRPAETAGFGLDAMELAIDTNEELAREILMNLRPERGQYSFEALPSLTLEVVPTEIKDQQGNVTRVIG